MPSLKDLLSLAPVPGLDFAVTLCELSSVVVQLLCTDSDDTVTTTYDNVQRISVYRVRLFEPG